MCSNEGDRPPGQLQMGRSDELCKFTMILDKLASFEVRTAGPALKRCA